MSIFFMSCMFLALFCVIGILGLGIVSMVKGGAFNQKYGNKLMQARVLMQGLAIAMFALAYLTSQF